MNRNSRLTLFRVVYYNDNGVPKHTHIKYAVCVITGEGRDKTLEQKEVNSSPVTKTPEWQLKAEHPSAATTKAGIAGTYQKRYPISKDKETTPYIPGGQPTSWKLYQKSSPAEVRVLSPCGSGMGGEGAPRKSGFEGQQGLITGIPQDWRKQKLHTWRHTKVS